MPNKPASKKPVVRKKASTSKKKKKSTVSTVGFSLFIVIMVLITIMVVVNHRRKAQLEIAAAAEQEEVIDLKTAIENAIKHSAELLGVPANLITRRVRDGIINYAIQLDRDRVDLTFGNMIVTGNIENAGGIIVKGEETGRGSAHVLTVKDPQSEQSFVVRLTYSRADAYPQQKPRLAIIVDDFGEFDGELLDAFFETDINVTFAILPHLRHSRAVMDRAVASGREVMLHIPMEPVNYPRDNPGTNPILVEQNERAIIRTMEGYFRNLPDVAGANNHMGSLATTDERVMRTLLEDLQERGMYFVDSRTTNLSKAFDIAQKMMLPSAKRDMFLDVPDSSEKTLKEKLDQLRTWKDTRRQVVVITHCFDRPRLNTLNRFVEEARKIGYDVVPVSRLFESDVPEIL